MTAYESLDGKIVDLEVGSASLPDYRASRASLSARAPAAPPASRRAPTSVSIPSCSTRYAASSPYTVYDIAFVWDDASAWRVSHRFSEFSTLYEALAPKVSKIPPLPSKKWFFNLDPKFVDERRAELEKWLRELVAIEPVLIFRESQAFFEMADHGVFLDTVDLHKFHLLSKFKDPHFGFNDFLVDEKLGIAISVQEDANITTRVDSFLVNLKLPWDQKSPEVPVGCTTVWKRTDKGTWISLLSRNYDCQASAVAWDKVGRRFFVGLQTGLIKQYKFDEEYSKVALLDDIRGQTLRISGLYFDSKRNLLISASRDGTAVLFDPSTGRQVCSMKLDDTALMCLEVDQESQRCFIGTSSYKILLVDYSRSSFRLITTLIGHTGVVRSLFYDRNDSYLFSGGFDSLAIIWKIGSIGEESVGSRRVGVLRGGPPAKVKGILFAGKGRRVVITGHDNGMVAVWSTRDGSLLNVIAAHSSSVVNIAWDDEADILRTIGRDGFINFWSLHGNPEGKDEVGIAKEYVKQDLYARLMKG